MTRTPPWNADDRRIELNQLKKYPVKVALSVRREIARAMYNGNFLILKKGSAVRADHGGSITGGVRRLREQAEKDGALGPIDSNGIRYTQFDLTFSSPSIAACFVLSCSANGRKVWRHKDNYRITLGEIIEKLDG